MTHLLIIAAILASGVVTNDRSEPTESRIMAVTLEWHLAHWQPFLKQGYAVLSRRTNSPLTSPLPEMSPGLVSSEAAAVFGDFKHRNREASTVPEVQLPIKSVPAIPHKPSGQVDWDEVDRYDASAEAVWEISRPGLSPDGNTAIVMTCVTSRDNLQRPFIYKLVRDGAGRWQVVAARTHPNGSTIASVGPPKP